MNKKYFGNEYKISYAVWFPDKEAIMFKKILVPLDGSDLAAKIIPQVETLAKHTNAQVTLLSVGSSNICAIGGAAAKGAEAAAPCPETPLANHLEQVTAKLKAAGIEANWVYKEASSGPARSWRMRTQTRWT